MEFSFFISNTMTQDTGPAGVLTEDKMMLVVAQENPATHLPPRASGVTPALAYWESWR